MIYEWSRKVESLEMMKGKQHLEHPANTFPLGDPIYIYLFIYLLIYSFIHSFIYFIYIGADAHTHIYLYIYICRSRLLVSKLNESRNYNARCPLKRSSLSWSYPLLPWLHGLLAVCLRGLSAKTTDPGRAGAEGFRESPRIAYRRGPAGVRRLKPWGFEIVDASIHEEGAGPSREALKRSIPTYVEPRVLRDGNRGAHRSIVVCRAAHGKLRRCLRAWNHNSFREAGTVMEFGPSKHGQKLSLNGCTWLRHLLLQAE